MVDRLIQSNRETVPMRSRWDGASGSKGENHEAPLEHAAFYWASIARESSDLWTSYRDGRQHIVSEQCERFDGLEAHLNEAEF